MFVGIPELEVLREKPMSIITTLPYAGSGMMTTSGLRLGCVVVFHTRHTFILGITVFGTVTQEIHYFIGIIHLFGFFTILKPFLDTSAIPPWTGKSRRLGSLRTGSSLYRMSRRAI